MEVEGKRILIEGEIPRIARLEQEWYEDVEDPRTLINQLCKSEPRPDILTFWQRLPDTEPKYSYPMELDSIAALPIKSYSLWWEKQIDRPFRLNRRSNRQASPEVQAALRAVGSA